MSKKTGKNKTRDSLRKTREKAVFAALDIAAAKGWRAVTLDAVAKKCRVSPEVLKKHYESPADLLAAYGAIIDQRVLEMFEPVPGNVRDALFDLLMARFDILNEHRSGVVAILDHLPSDPALAASLMRPLSDSMGRMLDAAGVNCGGCRKILLTAGLTGIYLLVLRTWKNDNSPDLAKTMAALDSQLLKANRLAEIVL